MRTMSSLLLALDTSTRTVSIALYDGQQILCEFSWASLDFHTVELAPAITDIFHRSAKQIGDLGAIGVATGPGSFTGLRIGMALAKGLSLALHIPIIGIRTLEILAYAQPIHEEQLAIVIKAGRERYAVAWFRAVNGMWSMKREVEVLTLEQIIESTQDPTTLCGEILSEDINKLIDSNDKVSLTPPARSLRRAGYLAEVAWQRWQLGQFDKPEQLVPEYLHYNDPIPGKKK